MEVTTVNTLASAPMPPPPVIRILSPALNPAPELLLTPLLKTIVLIPPIVTASIRITPPDPVLLSTGTRSPSL